jgi:hypothetical protein
MRRSVGVVALAAALAASHAVAATQTPIPFKDLFARYSAGDYDVVVRELRIQRDYDRIERDLARQRDLWKKQGWRRIQAVFFLEIVAVAYRQQWRDRDDVLESAREFMIARPGAPGASPDDDDFEKLWHRAALTILIGSLDGLASDRYITEVEARIGATPQTFASGPRLVEPRIALLHAQAFEQRLIPGAVWTETIVLAPGRTIYSSSTGVTPTSFAQVALRFDAAEACESCRDEAIVRRANVLLRINRAAEALAALERPVGPEADGTLRYWRQVIRGRTFDALNRLDDAAQAYGEARTLFPRAQSPLLALAVLRFRQGRVEEAQQWQDTVRRLPPEASDPWWSYWHGDGRFFPVLLTQLREAAK